MSCEHWFRFKDFNLLRTASSKHAQQKGKEMSEETQLSQLGDLIVGRAGKQGGGKPDISLVALFILHCQRDASRV